ncbi:MAG: hypothetical protein WCJ33_05785 [Pseudomonadota bacterium]
MNNTCNVCNKGFTPTTTKGSEQKYCSSTCRTIASQQRQKEKIINDYETEKTKIQGNGNGTNNIESTGYIGNNVQHTTENDYNRKRNDNIQPESSISKATIFGNIEYNIGNLERYYDAKAENRIISFELIKAQEKIQQLQNELNEYHEEDDEIEKLELAQKNAPQHEQIMKSFADMFREDPVNTTNMVKTLVPSIIGGITDMFKTKTA